MFIFVQALFALILGACFLVGEALSNWGLILLFCAGILIFRQKWQALSRAEIALSILLISYFVYFSLLDYVKPDLDAQHVFILQNWIFLYAPLLIVAFRDIDIAWVFRKMALWFVPLFWLTFAGAWYEATKLGIPRVDWTSSGVLSFALFLVLGVHLSLTDFRHPPKWLWPLLGVTWLAGWFVILKYTESRWSALIYPMMGGLFAAYVFCSVKFERKTNLWRLFLIAAISLAALIGLVAVALYFDLSHRLNGLVGHITHSAEIFDRSTSLRQTMWALAWQNLEQVPFFGLGPNNAFELVLADWPGKYNMDQLHNDALNLFAGGGYPGLAFYGALVFWPLGFLVSKSARDDRFIYVTLVVFFGIFLHGWTNRILLYQERSAWYVLALVFLQIYASQLHRKREAV